MDRDEQCYKSFETQAKKKRLQCLKFKGILILEKREYKDMSSRPFGFATEKAIKYPIAFINYKDHSNNKTNMQNLKDNTYATIIVDELATLLEDSKQMGNLFEYPCKTESCTQ